MITTVTSSGLVRIPAAVKRTLGIKPGSKLAWRLVEGTAEVRVSAVPDRGARARALLGIASKYSPERDAVSELIAERSAEG